MLQISITHLLFLTSIFGRLLLRDDILNFYIDNFSLDGFLSQLLLEATVGNDGLWDIMKLARCI